SRLYSSYYSSSLFFSLHLHHRSLHFSLHDALPIFILHIVSLLNEFMQREVRCHEPVGLPHNPGERFCSDGKPGHRRAIVWFDRRSEEHTSELQSRRDLVCRLLLEKKKKKIKEKYGEVKKPQHDEKKETRAGRVLEGEEAQVERRL